MIWHLSFSDFSPSSTHETPCISVSCSRLGYQHNAKVETYSATVHFERLNPDIELLGEWVSDNLFFLNATVGGKEGTIARAYIATDKQRLENKERSRHGNTDEGTYLFLDLEQDLRAGYPVEQIRERVYREYENWVIEEVIRDIGFTWLITPLADPTLPSI